MKRILILLALCCSVQQLLAQTQPDYSTVNVQTRPSASHVNDVSFTVTGLPDLTPWQLVGAPRAYYSCLWVFSDGDTARGPQVSHIFDRTGPVGAQLMLSSKYSSSGPPPAFRVGHTIGTGAMASTTPPGRILETTTNHRIESRPSNPPMSVTPGGQNRLAVCYGNPINNTLPDGRLVVFWNEKGRPITDFTYSETDTEVFSGETELSLSASDLRSLGNSYPKTGDARGLISEALKDYNSWTVFKTNTMAPQEQRAITLLFDCTNDTANFEGNVLTYKTLWLPDSMEIKTADHSNSTHMIAMRSHDPNCIDVNKSKAWWGKGQRAETLTYTVHFQNEGDGPATGIRIGVELDKSLDPETIELRDCSHQKGKGETSNVTHTVENGKLVWNLKEVYLYGVKQPQTERKKDTKGYLTFDISTGGKRSKNVPARASIIFDANDPILTNRVRTDYRKNQRYSVRAGVLWHTLGNETPVAGPFQYGFSNVFAEVVSNPVYSGAIGYGWSAGAQHLEFEFDEPLNEDTNRVVTLTQLDVAPLQLVKRFGWFRAEVGVPLQLNLRERELRPALGPLADTTNTFTGFGAGARLNLELQPTRIGFFAGIEARASYLSAVADLENQIWYMARLSVGWRF